MAKAWVKAHAWEVRSRVLYRVREQRQLPPEPAEGQPALPGVASSAPRDTSDRGAFQFPPLLTAAHTARQALLTPITCFFPPAISFWVLRSGYAMSGQVQFCVVFGVLSLSLSLSVLFLFVCSPSSSLLLHLSTSLPPYLYRYLSFLNWTGVSQIS